MHKDELDDGLGKKLNISEVLSCFSKSEVILVKEWQTWNDDSQQEAYYKSDDIEPSLLL